jgi:cobalamin biosynthetic protein CobC
MLEHGGNLRAPARYGGDDWIDLSTGINPHRLSGARPYAGCLAAPAGTDPALLRAACAYYGAPPCCRWRAPRPRSRPCRGCARRRA